MSHTNWFGNMLQGVQYRGMAPPNAEQALREVEGADDVLRKLSSLGARNAFSQEELAVYRKLESDGHALKGKALTLAASDAGLEEDPRIEIDRLAAETTTQRATLDRLQKRGENLSAEISQYKLLTAETLSTAAQLQREADVLESELNQKRDIAHESLLSIENATLETATEMCTSNHQPRDCLLSTSNVNGLEQLLGDLSLWSLNQVEGSKELISEGADEPGGFTILQEELSRLHDAHAVSRFGIAVADSELVSAQAELEFLQNIAQNGNPETERTPTELRSLIEEEQTKSKDIKEDIKLKLRTLFKTVQTQWSNPCTDWVISGIDVEEKRLREQLKLIEDLLYYQRQWWSAQIVAKQWIGREQLATENVEVGVADFITAMKTTLELSEILNQHNGDIPVSSLHHEAEQQGLDSIMDLCTHVSLDVTDLKLSLNRCFQEEHHTTTSLIDAHSELLNCLYSRRDASGNRNDPALPPTTAQTYFEQDLSCLKSDINDASDRLLSLIEVVEKDKRVFDNDWINQLKPNHLMVKNTNVGSGIATNVAVREEPHFVQLSEPMKRTSPTKTTNEEFESHEQAAEISYHKSSYADSSSRRLDKILDSSPGSDGVSLQPRRASPPRKLDYSPIRSKSDFSETSPVSSRGDYSSIDQRYSMTRSSYRPSPSIKKDPPKEPTDTKISTITSSQPSSSSVRKARTPAFLLRPDGTRMTAEEYRNQNMKLMQKLGKS
eukprot:TRINITY_DN17579_c0_g1_i1.p1 TRINITY_DN17579_c0_g1~~TRINITY_DN17579_c0_g1_i1.p1  ORF type:complete len:725 (+),score=159.64 TRINITY_DN17579_c0_g1_i1:52-2226(+)